MDDTFVVRQSSLHFSGRCDDSLDSYQQKIIKNYQMPKTKSEDYESDCSEGKQNEVVVNQGDQTGCSVNRDGRLSPVSDRGPDRSIQDNFAGGFKRYIRIKRPNQCQSQSRLRLL